MRDTEDLGPCAWQVSDTFGKKFRIEELTSRASWMGSAEDQTAIVKTTEDEVQKGWLKEITMAEAQAMRARWAVPRFSAAQKGGFRVIDD